MATTKEFELGRLYTRRQINRVVRGNLQHYLPHVDKTVVCGCFVPKLNPDAPNVVLPGVGPSIEQAAEWFWEKRNAVPVFLKEAPRRV